MNTERAYWTLQEIAKQQGITVEKVMADIDESIREAIATIKRTNDVKTMKEWKKIPCVGEISTAVELVAYLGERLISEMHGYNDAAPFNKQIGSN